MLFGSNAKETTGETSMRETERVYPNSTMPAAPANRETAAAPVANTPRPAPAAAAAPLKESVLAAELIIEGKIEGTGHVRIAGKFKGDVQVRGNVSVEQGAVVTGEIKAEVVVIAGQVDGNIDAVTRVELQPSGVVNGDIKSASLTVAAGSRMRGRAEFGWTDKS
jgi:cytoskeletal protein CcmA (bactofilin family)